MCGLRCLDATCGWLTLWAVVVCWPWGTASSSRWSMPGAWAPILTMTGKGLADYSWLGWVRDHHTMSFMCGWTRWAKHCLFVLFCFFLFFGCNTVDHVFCSHQIWFLHNNSKYIDNEFQSPMYDYLTASFVVIVIITFNWLCTCRVCLTGVATEEWESGGQEDHGWPVPCSTILCSDLLPRRRTPGRTHISRVMEGIQEKISCSLCCRFNYLSRIMCSYEHINNIQINFIRKFVINISTKIIKLLIAYSLCHI